MTHEATSDRAASGTATPGATPDTLRTVQVERTGPGRFTATNARGGTVSFGSGGGDDFTPVELLLAALGGCTAIDADVATTRHAEPDEFVVRVSGDKISDDLGSRMANLAVTFSVVFPEGEGGDKARAILPRAVRTSHDKLCTVSRTIEIGTPVTSTIATAAAVGGTPDARGAAGT